MAYLFGWQRSDLTLVAGLNTVISSNTVLLLGDAETSGFLAAEDGTVENVVVAPGNTNNLKVAIYDSGLNLLAQSANTIPPGDLNDLSVPLLSSVPVTAGNRYFIAVHAADPFRPERESATFETFARQTVTYADGPADPFVKDNATAEERFILYADGTPAATTTPVLRKSSTFDIETTLGTITTATLNSVNVFDHLSGQAGTTVSFEGAATDEITTSGEYTLTLGDGVGTENITVQVNVVGLASFNINKDGTDQGSLTDVEFIILTGAAGSRAISDQITGITTTAGGDTGPIEITDTALNVDDTITVVQQSPTVGGGVVHASTLVLI